MDDSLLEQERVVVDDEQRYAQDIVYRLKETGEVVCRMRGYTFEKVNPFAADVEEILIEEEGVRSTELTSSLLKQLVVVDNDREYSCAVEYRRPGSDVIVHRSAATSLKAFPAMQSAQGGFRG
jgi:ribulose-5-phosphate 4-epimerase/fuculose-1-phosphate aldolase